MIARIWRGRATAEKADQYYRHFTRAVAPHLREIAGHRGAYLLRREVGAEVEFLAVTLWDSLAVVKTFAGDKPDVAVIEPEARAVLSDFDTYARHYEVAHSSVPDTLA